MKSILQLIPVFLLAAISAFPCATADAKPLKVFILAGQSNMEGHAKVETFDYIGDDPATATLLKQMRGADGKPSVCDHVWISYLTGSGDQNGEGIGKLTAGFGARRNPTQDDGKIGPEFTFWPHDGRSAEGTGAAHQDRMGRQEPTYGFPSANAGPYELSSFQRENYPKQTGHGIPEKFRAVESRKG
jgi:alpha-galactosidase